MSDTTTGGKAVTSTIGNLGSNGHGPIRIEDDTNRIESDTTTGTTSPLSMEDAKTLKFIAELQGRIGELEQALVKERAHSDELAYLLSIYRHAHDSDSRVPGSTVIRTKDVLAEHAKLRGAQ